MSNFVSQAKVEKISSFLWATVIILPVMITPYPPWDMYSLPKAIFLWLLAPVFVFYLYHYRAYKADVFLKTIVAFFMVHLLSTMLSLDIKRSIFGANGWYEGFVVITVYCFLFILAKNFLRLDLKKMKVFIIIGLLSSIYALFQLHSIDPLNDGHSYPPGSAITTFGNRNSYGILALVIAIICTWLYIHRGGRRLFLFSSLAYGGLLASCTRSCWLAYAIACAILLAFSFKKPAIRNRCFKFLLPIFMIFAALDYTSSGMLTGRVATTLENAEQNREKLGSFRLIIWEEAVKALSFENNLAFGFGPDTFDLGLKKYNMAGVHKLSNITGKTFDKAHNEYLQMVCNAGIFALLIYLFLLFKVYKNIWRNRKDPYWQCCFTILTAYLLQAFLNNSTVGIAPIYWAFLGFCCRDSVDTQIHNSSRALSDKQTSSP